VHHSAPLPDGGLFLHADQHATVVNILFDVPLPTCIRAKNELTANIASHVIQTVAEPLLACSTTLFKCEVSPKTYPAVQLCVPGCNFCPYFRQVTSRLGKKNIKAQSRAPGIVYYSANWLNCPHAQRGQISSWRNSCIIGSWDIAEVGPFQNRRERTHGSCT
jgi:hypothetical protein